MIDRSSGILMHITSLPSPYGIGTMGEDARKFIDFLSDAGQKYWQVLPLGQTGFGDSPYQCFSSAAGNPYLIDLDTLCEDGLLQKEELAILNKDSNPDKVDFERIASTRFDILRKAFERIDNETKKEIEVFKEENSEWIEDYALFISLKKYFSDKAVWEWEDISIKVREPHAITTYKVLLKEQIDFYTFIQYEFFKQWNALKEYANAKGIKIIGDIPIYVSPDSVEVWSNSRLFKINKDLTPRMVAGVPPDYYSETGQLWGNPVYDWRYHQDTEFDWWIWRIKHNSKLFDVIRIDHFRGFLEYWEVPNGETTAVNGVWVKGPGMKLFQTIKSKIGDVPIIAEDLGDIDAKVRMFVKKSGYPGMKVMIFGFDPEIDSDHLPHNYIKNVVAYTSTHDSQTICEQVMDIATDKEREFAYRYLRTSPNEAIGWSAIKCLFASSANLAMTTMQDVLSLGKDARMNIPSTMGENWRWRVRAEAINKEVAVMLKDITKTYKR